MSREFWPSWFRVDEWLPHAAPYIELALDHLWLWLWIFVVLPLVVVAVARGEVRRILDRCADQTAGPVRGHHLISSFGYFAILVAVIDKAPWFAIVAFFVLLGLSTALQNRRGTLEYYRMRGIDPYNKKQRKEDRERLRRELQEKGIIPPGD